MVHISILVSQQGFHQMSGSALAIAHWRVLCDWIIVLVGRNLFERVMCWMSWLCWWDTVVSALCAIVFWFELGVPWRERNICGCVLDGCDCFVWMWTSLLLVSITTGTLELDEAAIWFWINVLTWDVGYIILCACLDTFLLVWDDYDYCVMVRQFGLSWMSWLERNICVDVKYVMILFCVFGYFFLWDDYCVMVRQFGFGWMSWLGRGPGPAGE